MHKQLHLVLVPDSFSLFEVRKQNPDSAEDPGQVIGQLGAAEAAALGGERGREALEAFLAGRGCRFCSAFVLEQFPWCPCFVVRPVCRQRSSPAATQDEFTRRGMALLHGCAAGRQPPQISRRLSHGCSFRK